MSWNQQPWCRPPCSKCLGEKMALGNEFIYLCLSPHCNNEYQMKLLICKSITIPGLIWVQQRPIESQTSCNLEISEISNWRYCMAYLLHCFESLIASEHQYWIIYLTFKKMSTRSQYLAQFHEISCEGLFHLCDKGLVNVMLRTKHTNKVMY